jgi:hypothetical protein
MENEALALGSRLRYALAMLGALFATAGGIAVFVSDNQAGTVALVIVGAVLVLLAVNGMKIESLAFGEYKAVFVQIYEHLEEVFHNTHNGNFEVAERAFDQAMNRYGSRLSAAKQAEYSAAEQYRDQVLGCLEAVLPEDFPEFEGECKIDRTYSGASPFPIVDAVLSMPYSDRVHCPEGRHKRLREKGPGEIVRAGIIIRPGSEFEPELMSSKLASNPYSRALALDCYLLVARTEGARKIDQFCGLADDGEVHAGGIAWMGGRSEMSAALRSAIKKACSIEPTTVDSRTPE